MLILGSIVIWDEKKKQQVVHFHVTDLSLWTILYTITWEVGSMGPHLASRSHVSYVMMCLSPTIYNWCSGILVNMKEQLTKCRTRRQNKFGYGSILLSLFFKKVPSSSPLGDMAYGWTQGSRP
jgi:hypothetical protein